LASSISPPGELEPKSTRIINDLPLKTTFSAAPDGKPFCRGPQTQLGSLVLRALSADHLTDASSGDERLSARGE
jgi:hypothetical protein